jgi:pimeloyl-ACP methyl ester carboxylesterase
LSSTHLSPISKTVEGYSGVPINVWDYGGDGPDLVLCHCTGTHARIWDPLVPELLKHFRVLAPDTRGHGLSGKPDDLAQYEWLHSGDDLLAVVEQLALGPVVHAVGHSAGAAQVAYCQLYHPGTFNRAVLIDPIIGPPEAFSKPNPLGELARRRKREFESLAAARDRFGSKPPMEYWTSESLDAYVSFGLEERADGTATLRCPPEVEGVVYDGGGALDVFPRLSEISFEKFAHVTASNSNVRGLIEVQRPGFSEAKFVEIPGAGHFIPQEKPSETLAIILDTLL